MFRHYKLDENRTPVPCTFEEWGAMFESPDRIVKQDEFPGTNIRVSTVFLGLDHRFGDPGPPLLFETMIFGGEHDQWQERCSTWKEAEGRHAIALELVKETLSDED